MSDLLSVQNTKLWKMVDLTPYYFMNHTFSFAIQHPLFNLHTS